MSVLKVKNEKGEWVGIPSIKGEKGDPGELTPEQLDAINRAAEAVADADEALSQVNAHILNESNPHKVTPEQIGASPTGHNHDERYYTEAEANALLATKAPFPTWGTEDIEAGSASASPTGTVHYVIE